MASNLLSRSLTAPNITLLHFIVGAVSDTGGTIPGTQWRRCVAASTLLRLADCDGIGIETEEGKQLEIGPVARPAAFSAERRRRRRTDDDDKRSLECHTNMHAHMSGFNKTLRQDLAPTFPDRRGADQGNEAGCASLLPPARLSPGRSAQGMTAPGDPLQLFAG